MKARDGAEGLLSSRKNCPWNFNELSLNVSHMQTLLNPPAHRRNPVCATVSVLPVPPLEPDSVPAQRMHRAGSCRHASLAILPFPVTHPQPFSNSSLPLSSLSGAISSGWLLISTSRDHLSPHSYSREGCK